LGQNGFGSGSLGAGYLSISYLAAYNIKHGDESPADGVLYILAFFAFAVPLYPLFAWIVIRKLFKKYSGRKELQHGPPEA